MSWRPKAKPSGAGYDITGWGRTSERADTVCLLVEDSVAVSIDKLRRMNEVGFEEVQTATALCDALRTIAHHRPGFAVLDMNLTGHETSPGVARQLAELYTHSVCDTGDRLDGVPCRGGAGAAQAFGEVRFRCRADRSVA